MLPIVLSSVASGWGMLKWKLNVSATSCQQPQVLKLTVGSLMTNFIEEKKTRQSAFRELLGENGFQEPVKKVAK